MNRILRSLSFRLALTYAGLLCVSVALLMGAGYWLRVAMPMEQQREAVDAEAQTYARELAKAGMAPVAQMLEQRDHLAGTRKPFHALIAPDGTVVSSNLPSWPPHGNARFTIIEADAFLDGFEIDYSSLTRDILMPDGTRLLVGRDVDDIVRDQHMLRTAALWILCGTMVLGLSGGWLMSHAIGKRLEAVTNAARQVMDGDLSGRVRVHGTNDDFDRLSETLNLMLSRIQMLFESTRRVSDNVAHELRTPLARLVGQLEDIEQRAGDDHAMHAAIEAAIDDANRLRQIFAALLRISRLEGGRHPLHLQATDVVQLLEDVIELYQPEADSRGITLVLRAQRPLVAMLDLDLVFQALSNLLDNALKYVPEGGQVTVSAEAPDGLRVEVADDGPGIAPAHVERATEPFYRGNPATRASGEGLGLSMVAAIAQAHGATLTLEDTFSTPRQGLRVAIGFPG